MSFSIEQVREIYLKGFEAGRTVSFYLLTDEELEKEFQDTLTKIEVKNLVEVKNNFNNTKTIKK